MHQNHLHYLHYHKFKIFQKKHLLIIASFLILTLLPSESWAPPVSSRGHLTSKSARHGSGRIRNDPVIRYSKPIHGPSDHRSVWKKRSTPQTQTMSSEPPAPESGKSARHLSTHQTQNEPTEAERAINRAFNGIFSTKLLPVTEAKEKNSDNIFILEKLGYTGEDATRRFETDFGLRNQSNIDSTAQAIFEARRNGLSVGSNAILYTIFPGKDLDSLFRYILVDKNGNLISKSNNTHQIRNSINHRHEKIVYLDVTRFLGDQQKALLLSLKIGTMADGDGKAHFQSITLNDLPIENRSEMREMIFSPILQLEIPNNNAIVEERSQAKVNIKVTTVSNKSFTVRITAKTKKTLRSFLSYLRKIRIHIGLFGLMLDFKKKYHNKIKIEVRNAARYIEIAEYLYNKKRTGLAFTPKIYWISNQLSISRGG